MQAALYKSMFSGSANDADFLHNITKQHPYFAVAHYFLLKNKTVNAADYNETANKTALFFDNPYLLNAQLNNIDQKVNESTITIEDADDTDKVDENATNEMVEVATTNDNALTQITTTAAPAKEPLLFEPLHATDYFASQGIKLTAEMLKDDKLGMQLKSFTSWLKTMKKVHPDKLPEVSKQIEKAVQSLAEKSNNEAEILTEAMAIAYEQQGKNQRAIDIYSKLSLINPAKNTYFAAKIESLKK
ncbi:hypothetical protein ACFOWM_03760 [Ferruginibacter yonginensis]|uniref:Tetratricopeptide repeat protein n=1 Tax=Ferruginibacter yonginensis TaxID=1310416 RepID=A0ABV8QNX1_9BACT